MHELNITNVKKKKSLLVNKYPCIQEIYIVLKIK